MEMFETFSLVFATIYLFFAAFLVDTSGFMNRFTLKFLPFILGLGLFVILLSRWLPNFNVGG